MRRMFITAFLNPEFTTPDENGGAPGSCHQWRCRDRQGAGPFRHFESVAPMTGSRRAHSLTRAAPP